MNQDQVGGLIRAAMAALSGYAIAFGFTDAQWVTITAAITAIITVIWSLYVHSSTQQIVTAAENPEVHAVVLKDTGLAMSIPESKVIPIGGKVP